MHAEPGAARTEVPAGDLARLLDAETRFGAKLAEARGERDRIVAEARAHVAALEAAFPERLTAELEAVRAHVVEEMAASLAEFERDAAARLRLYERIGDDQIQALAGAVLAELVSPSEDGPERAP